MNTATGPRTARRREPELPSSIDGHPYGDGVMPPSLTDTSIAERAYARFLARGGEHGRDLDDWLDAERAVREEQRSVAASTPVS